MIQLIGPGGAGKSTAGRLIADRLGCPFFDLDRCFETMHGDIDRFLARYGYDAYARANVDAYAATAPGQRGVFALSSGFMTYAEHSHPALPALRAAIVSSRATVLLLPSFDLATCVAETVRRQRDRALPRGRSDAREAAVIRRRFPIYRALPVRQVETMAARAVVAGAVLAILRAADATRDGVGAHAL